MSEFVQDLFLFGESRLDRNSSSAVCHKTRVSCTIRPGETLRNMIQLTEVRKSFDQLMAVDGLSLEIPAGKTFGLLGPNGAGKTTTIRMLIGALAPDSGTLTVDEQDASNPSVRKKIGVAPQSLAIYEAMTPRENLKFFGELYGFYGKRLKERIQWALDFSQLNDRANSRSETFSGGMKRRLNLAIALIHDPSVLLLDEPTVGVDPQSRNHIFDCIEQLKSEGKTIIYTSHYMDEVERLCDTVAIMDRGKLLDCDTSAALVAKHATAAEVSAEVGEDATLGDLPGTIEGGVWKFESVNPFAELNRANSTGLEIRALNMNQPNLESVFLNLTGRSLRD